MTSLRSATLTVGAILGSVCLLVAVAGLVAGVKPLVFRSGSMGPEIPAGSLGLSRPVAAAELTVGDVVSVINRDGARVTHRIVAIDVAGSTRDLTLRGDANPGPDAESYSVAAADRVFWSAPGVGYVVAWLGGPLGLLVLGGVCVGVLVLGFRRPPGPPRGGRRRAATTGAAGVVATVLLLQLTAGTSAAFSDTAGVSSGSVGAATLASPASAGSNNCTANNGVLSSSIDLRWVGVTPAAPVPLANHEYVLRFFNRANNAQVGPDVVRAHAGGAGATQAVNYGDTLLGNLLGLNLLSSTNIRLEVRSRLIGTTWYGSSVVSTNFHTQALLGIVNFTCNV